MLNIDLFFEYAPGDIFMFNMNRKNTRERYKVYLKIIT